jgi:hypothetical protein
MSASYVLTGALLAGILLIGLASNRRSSWTTVALLALVVLLPALFYATL